MSGTLSPKRPWLAALLAVVVTGLGHLYLRRWRRALGWVAVVFGAATFFVDPAALGSLASANAVDPLSVAPILVVAGLSVVDAYLLAHAHNAVARSAVPADGAVAHCPACGKELDQDLGFCHWCTTEFGDPEPVLQPGGEERDAGERP